MRPAALGAALLLTCLGILPSRLDAARLYPALAAVTPGVQAEVDRILAEERAKLNRSSEAGGPTLDEVLRELEAAEGSAAAPADQPPEPKPTPPAPERVLLQQLRTGYSQIDLEAANLTVPTTQDAFVQYQLDYRAVKDPRNELDLLNVLQAGTLKTENFLDAIYVYTPDERLRVRARQRLELQKNSAQRLTNDYDLNATELTFDYNFPVRLRALVRGFVENKSFDREGAFNFNSRTKHTEFYLERPFMAGTYSADLINEAQYFDSDPASNFKRQTLNVSARGNLSRRFDAEARYVRQRHDRNLAGEVLDYDDGLWIFLVDYRMTEKLILRAERDLEDKVFEVPDDINFNFRRRLWRPSLTYLPSQALTLILDASFESKRHFDVDAQDLILERDEDFDTTGATLTATYVRDKLFVTASLGAFAHDHILPDTALQADFVSRELSGSATYNFSAAKSLSLSYSRTEDSFESLASTNDSASTILTGDLTYRF
ncbi:MAG: hypothetical protein HY816_22290 [Candidatus Wallbacteria bacterium]|nr:hypothetical protein [Candidatus Wallbacteria bacterium]